MSDEELLCAFSRGLNMLSREEYWSDNMLGEEARRTELYGMIWAIVTARYKRRKQEMSVDDDDELLTAFKRALNTLRRMDVTDPEVTGGKSLDRLYRIIWNVVIGPSARANAKETPDERRRRRRRR